jgi:hypothetical protein
LELWDLSASHHPGLFYEHLEALTKSYLHLLRSWVYRHVPPHPTEQLLGMPDKNCRAIPSFLTLVTQQSVYWHKEGGGNIYLEI